jgi:hypothetical protein
MRNRIVILVIALVMIAGLLACGTGGLLSRTEPTATPTKTQKPTFTVTLTPTNTPIPTDTPTPTNTATPTPEATNTPIVYTATPTPLPTDTPVPTAPPTNTPRPTARPQPKATNTPRPPTPTPKPSKPWTGQVTNTMTNCGLTRVFGFTLDRNGGLAGDIWVHYWTDGWEGDWAKSQWTDFGAGTSWKGDEGNWDGTIDTRVREGVWHVCVAPEDGSWDCISNTVDAATTFDCASAAGVNVVHITFRQN